MDEFEKAISDGTARGTQAAYQRLVDAGVDVEEFAWRHAEDSLPAQLVTDLEREGARATVQARDLVGADRLTPDRAGQAAEVLAAAPWDHGPTRTAIARSLAIGVGLEGGNVPKDGPAQDPTSVPGIVGRVATAVHERADQNRVLSISQAAFPAAPAASGPGLSAVTPTPKHPHTPTKQQGVER